MSMGRRNSQRPRYAEIVDRNNVNSTNPGPIQPLGLTIVQKWYATFNTTN